MCDSLKLPAVRSCATYSFLSFNNEIVICGISIQIIASVVFTSWALRADDFTKPAAYCSAATVTSAGRVTVLVFSLCGVDVLTLIGILVLYIFNDIALKRKIFDLQSSYQLRENICVIRFILPLTVFQTICYLIFSASTGVISLFESSVSLLTYRTLFAAFYVIPYYTMIAPILIWFIIRWSQQLKQSRLRRLKMQNTDGKEVYFRTYADMWNSELSNKH
ncbi:hypothetical protein Y032_0535g3086 [Ancylostoma ceylanicum]|uniref:G-protein coupled receptors family 1 profile domain-containing protein n=1 Tax=Ancylostoma ceylanicum TaxID=53326 RepID=A0A016WRN5_9BILA|nr:hypothetical protein Y032_0535g3086 [Ancylostoma ceylanicum]